MDNKQIFEDAYNKVFDKNNNITACGRETCKKLITAANTVKGYKPDDTTYGDISSGVLKIDNVKSLYDELFG